MTAVEASQQEVEISERNPCAVHDTMVYPRT